MTLGFMNGQQEALPLAESDSQSGRIICNRGLPSGFMLQFDTTGKEMESPRASICGSQNGCCNSPTLSAILVSRGLGDEEGEGVGETETSPVSELGGAPLCKGQCPALQTGCIDRHTQPPAVAMETSHNEGAVVRVGRRPRLS
ncbi:hypothetical protein Q8A73_023051 [Channa argus]|nr:hypothetical protein Q8A73_023051 [Channa argus]